MEVIAKQDVMQLRLQNAIIARYIDTMNTNFLSVFMTCADVMMLTAADGGTRTLPCAKMV